MEKAKNDLEKKESKAREAIYKRKKIQEEMRVIYYPSDSNDSQTAQ